MKKTFLLILITASFISAQQKTNFEVMQKAVESSINKLIVNIDKNENYNLEVTTPDKYSVFSSTIKNNFTDKLTIRENENSGKINFSLNEITINYNDCFRDGIFGSFYTERTVDVNSSYTILSREKLLSGDNLIITIRDTVNLDEIESLENSAYSFTKSKKPEEPFISGLTEPLIVISALAVSVYLLFSVRSN